MNKLLDKVLWLIVCILVAPIYLAFSLVDFVLWITACLLDRVGRRLKTEQIEPRY